MAKNLISVDVLSKVSTAHLRKTKTSELLKAYTKLHEEYKEFLESEPKSDDEAEEE